MSQSFRSGFLQLNGMSVALSGRTIVRNVSFCLPQGHLVALVGPNGAGKTTLLKSLCGLLPSSGVLRIDGEDVSKLSILERARRFGYLPQGHLVHWPLPVRDIVALGRYPHGAVDPSRLSDRDERAVTEAMIAADVTHFSDRRVTELSGGERSRVALARVLAIQSPVVLADEPVASLDPRYQIDVMSLLRNVADNGALVIAVMHDLGFAARFADCVLVLSDGELVADGSPQEALTEAILADVFRVSVFRASHEGTAVIVPWARAQ